MTAVSETTRSGRISSDVVIGAAAAALACACLLSPVAASGGPVVCPLRLATGLPCPGCGSVRAWSAMAHGDVGAALASNPFASGLFVVAAALVAWRVAAMLVPAPRPDLERIVRAPASAALLAAWVAWAVVRAVGA